MGIHHGDIPTERAAAPPVGELLDRLIEEVKQTAATPSDVSQKASADQASDMAPSPIGALGGLLSNPAIMSVMPQLINSLGALSKGAASEDHSTGTETKESAPTKVAAGGLHPDRHTALLCALKPYLGAERRQAAEYLINLCRIWNTLQGMGINVPALLMPSANDMSRTNDQEV